MHTPDDRRPRQEARSAAGVSAKIGPACAKVLALVALGRSYRLISRELGLSKNTVADIARRKRAASALP
jgi:DNA-binding CsgD family transcriptional regulator